MKFIIENWYILFTILVLILATIYSFDKFSKDIDHALEWIDDQLKTNPAFENYIES